MPKWSPRTSVERLQRAGVQVDARLRNITRAQEAFVFKILGHYHGVEVEDHKSGTIWVAAINPRGDTIRWLLRLDGDVFTTKRDRKPPARMLEIEEVELVSPHVHADARDEWYEPGFVPMPVMPLAMCTIVEAEDPAERVLREDHCVYAQLEMLSYRERQILELRLGLTGESQTLDEVGKTFNITRERVRQIQAQAIRTLRILNGLQDEEQVTEEKTTKEEEVVPETNIQVAIAPLTNEGGNVTDVIGLLRRELEKERLGITQGTERITALEQEITRIREECDARESKAQELEGAIEHLERAGLQIAAPERAVRFEDTKEEPAEASTKIVLKGDDLRKAFRDWIRSVDDFTQAELSQGMGVAFTTASRLVEYGLERAWIQGVGTRRRNDDHRRGGRLPTVYAYVDPSTLPNTRPAEKRPTPEQVAREQAGPVQRGRGQASSQRRKHSNPELELMLAAAEAAGWEIRHGGKHWKAVAPSGVFVTVPTTTNKDRTIKNIRGHFRRLGLEI